QRAGIELAEPREVPFGRSDIEARDEILVTAQHDHDDETGDQRQIDGRQAEEDYVCAAIAAEPHRRMQQLAKEIDDEDDEEQGEAEIEGSEEPAASKERLFYEPFEPAHPHLLYHPWLRRS